MALFLYRAIRKAIKDHQENRISADSSDSVTVQDVEITRDSEAAQDPAGPKTPLRWRILLMAALLIPVFLETLDYTGELSSVRCYDCMLTIVQSSQRRKYISL